MTANVQADLWMGKQDALLTAGQGALYKAHMEFTALKEAVRLLEGQAAVARVAQSATGRRVRQQNVWWWLNRGNGNVPPEFATAIADACREKDPETSVTREALAPDFPWNQLAPSGQQINDRP